jgi:hypothetical protein
VKALLLAAAAAVLTTTADAATSPRLDVHAVPVPAPAFAKLPAGWRAYATPGDLTPSGAWAGTFATSWRYRLATPEGPAGSMPGGAVLVQVWLSRSNAGRSGPSLCGRTPHIPGHPEVKLPLRLPATTTATDMSGAWPEYRIFGRLGNQYNLEVRVDVTSHHPTKELLARAAKVVAQIELPRWPRPASC